MYILYGYMADVLTSDDRQRPMTNLLWPPQDRWLLATTVEWCLYQEIWPMYICIHQCLDIVWTGIGALMHNS